MRARVKRFVQSESGTTAIEYAIIAGGIALAIIAVLQSVGMSVMNDFVSVNTALK
jgi:pilus assembly protein Flp/PilA